MTPQEARRRKKRQKPDIRLTDIELAEVSLVDMPANPGARVMLFKNTSNIDAAGGGGDAPPAADHAARIAELEAALAERDALLAERDAQLAHLAERLLEDEAEPAPIRAPPPSPPPARVETAHEREAAELGGLAIVAREGRYPETRAFWRAAIDQLGRHLAPDEPPARQLRIALQDPRGQDLLRALQDSPA